MVTLNTLIKDAIKTSGTQLKKLESIGITTVRDIIEYLPRTYEDRKIYETLREIPQEIKKVSLKAKVVHSELLHTRARKAILRVKVQDAKGISALCVWFGQTYVKDQLLVNGWYVFTGNIKIEQNQLSMVSPEIEPVMESRELVHSGGLVPIYVESERIKGTWFRERIHTLLKVLPPTEEIFPAHICKEYVLMSKDDAYKEVHTPTTPEVLVVAKHRLAFEELCMFQLLALKRKQEAIEKNRSVHKKQCALLADKIKEFLASLPFELTDGQKIAIYEIIKDMGSTDLLMSRLLEGDVGSGKTIVAATVIYNTLLNGFQCALVAPTEILAEQHMIKLTHYFERYGISIALLTGSTKQSEKTRILAGLASGEIQLVIGTHAVLQETVVFQHLGVVIIDEQHRFGVEQRAHLVSRFAPHVLTMTATPIPRSLALIMYGDQDLSILSESPKNRLPIQTQVVTPLGRSVMYRHIISEIDKGNQVFVICPLVEESEKLELKSATNEYEILKQAFPKTRIALLHGRMPSADKQAIMEDMKQKKYDILVSTSVIEVGIDIPDATVIVIEGAERFGLSQLHQFRGRVGRSAKQSYCYLAASDENKNEVVRLRAMEDIQDGFKLSQLDLKLRGPGEVYGFKQSGFVSFRMSDLRDLKTLSEARACAQTILEEDPTLSKYPLLKSEIESFQKRYEIDMTLSAS